MICENALKKRAVERGWGYHSQDNGKFIWDNLDAEYVINGVSHDEESEHEQPAVFNLRGIRVKKD